MRATETNVLNFIGGLDKVFIIPPFQRNYAWTIDECGELYEDIVSANKTGKSHYLGNVVYYYGEKSGASYTELILVDGQQRVTTVLLLLCAIRDTTGDSELRNSINKRYLLNDVGENKARVRLKQTSYDQKSFLNIINGECDGADNNVNKNYWFFKKMLSEPGCEIEEIYETIPRLEVVDVNLQIQGNLSAVQTVFEKINSTGKPLSPADLIRNYLLLCSSSAEQEMLYKDYWVKIENDVLNENVSKFSRDYLVMKTFNDVQDEKIYKTFKSYVEDRKIEHEVILKEMRKISEMYAWIIFGSCPDEKINNMLKKLILLRTDDIYPLLLYIFISLYSNDIAELRRIMNILTHFMIRYRIVAPGGGGGSLRTVVQTIIEKMSAEEIDVTYDALHIELSNSNSPLGRYPLDEEFKSALINKINPKYAKVLLLEIEEAEKDNIPVSIDKVTIEHVMPQVLSKKWIEYLGGAEQATQIHEQYLNCIGNLAPISQSYNSKNSNREWEYKREQLGKVQFFVTSEIAHFLTWRESDIQKRTNDIAERACKCIISPLPRKKKYQMQKPTEEFESGIYPITDIDTPMNGTTIKSLIYLERNIDISTWKDLLNVICELAYAYNSEKFTRMVYENKIHKATSKKNYPEKDPIITFNMEHLVEAKQVVGTEMFSEGCISSNRSRFYAKQIVEYVGLADDISILVEK